MTSHTRRSSALPSAKIQLLDWLKASGSWEAMLLSDELLDARTFRELAERAHAIVIRLQEVNEWKVAGAFWEAAKDIVARWRDAAQRLKAEGRRLRTPGLAQA